MAQVAVAARSSRKARSDVKHHLSTPLRSDVSHHLSKLELATTPSQSSATTPRMVAAFSTADIGKRVSITGDHVVVNGDGRNITWGDARHSDMQGVIRSVDAKYKGKVILDDHNEFENGVMEEPTYHVIVSYTFSNVQYDDLYVPTKLVCARSDGSWVGPAELGGIVCT